MPLLTVSDADRRRRKAELAEFKADMAIIRERFQKVKLDDTQLSFQLRALHEQEDNESPDLINGRGIRAYEPPAIRKMYESMAAMKESVACAKPPPAAPRSPATVSPQQPAATSPSNAENQQPASSSSPAPAGAFSLIQDLLSGQRLFSEVLPWSRSNPTAESPANSGDALLKQAGLDGFTLLSPNSQSQNQSPEAAQLSQKESATSQPGSVGLLPFGSESPDSSSALSPGACNADAASGSSADAPRLSRVRRSAYRVGGITTSSSPACSTSSLRTSPSAQAPRAPSPSRIVSLSENSPSCVGQGVSPSSSGSSTRAMAASGTNNRPLTAAQQLRAELAERRSSGGATKLFSDAAKEALLVRAGLLPGPGQASAARARSSEDGAGADAAGAASAALGERVAQSASAGTSGVGSSEFEKEGLLLKGGTSVAESIRLSGELRSRLRAVLGEGQLNGERELVKRAEVKAEVAA